MPAATFLIDLSHTSHTQARTGIQRVARSLLANLPAVEPITFDPYENAWRPLAAWEKANLESTTAAASRGARWPFAAKLSGRWRGLVGSRPVLPASHGLIVPELFSPAVFRALPRLFAQVAGPKIALFHDAIALQRPGAAPAKTVTRFPAYLKELLAFDGIAAISEASRDSLLGYWAWLGIPIHPPVQAIPLGTDRPTAPVSAPATGPVRLLYVSSVEARKNHVALLEACESLWAAGESFTLELIGLSHPTSGRAALNLITALQAKGRPVLYAGAVPEADLERAYRECTFTVYPSVLEGFGLPVIESVLRGRPCVCSAQGAIGESARGGGCLTLDRVDAPSLAAGIKSLLHDPAGLARLSQEGLARRDKGWAAYAGEIAAWANSLKTAPGRS